MITLFILLFAIFIFFISSFFVVEQQTSAIVERFGKFNRIALPGLNLKLPFIEKVRARLSLRVRQLDVQVETKSKDNVFAKIMVSVQFCVLEEKIFAAFYKLAWIRYASVFSCWFFHIPSPLLLYIGVMVMQYTRNSSVK